MFALNGQAAAREQREFLFVQRLLFLLHLFFETLEPPRDLVEVGEHQFEIE